MNIEQNVETFRKKLMFYVPFYGEIIAHIPFVSDNKVPTAQTNGLRIRYSPKFFATLNQGQQNYVLMHEVMHILLKHCQRKDERRPDLWNAACDLLVNQMLDTVLREQLKERGISIERPPAGLFLSSGHKRGLSAESYYSNLEKLNPTQKKTITLEEGYGSNKKTVEIPVPDDLPLEAVQAQINEKLNDIIRQALNSSKQRSCEGSIFIPNQIIEIDIRKPLPWKLLLKDLMNEYEDDSDSSWTTPERKYIHMDLLLPGHCRSEADSLEEVWAFVDSSGSISSEEISRFLDELWHLLHDFHCVMNLAYWDTQVTEVYLQIDGEKKLKDCMPKHTGGTDINCVYRYIVDNKLKPQVLLILTDGMFGTLTDQGILRSLRNKTVMVLSNAESKAQFKQYGRVASL